MRHYYKAALGAELAAAAAEAAEGAKSESAGGDSAHDAAEELRGALAAAEANAAVAADEGIRLEGTAGYVLAGCNTPLSYSR